MSRPIVGILLAAGAGHRFGDDKLLHPLADGRPVAVAAAGRLVAAVPDSIAVVRPEASVLADRLRECGLRVVVNEQAATGMGGSLACGVGETAGAAGWVVALGDMPWIETATITAVAVALHGGANIAAPAYRGRRGHPVGFAARYRSELGALRGDRGARDIIARHAGDLVTLELDDPGVLLDIDERGDLEDAATPAGRRSSRGARMPDAD